MHATLFDQTALSCLCLSGNNIRDFLQGLLTCDVNNLDTHTASATLLCQHQGKTVASGIICLLSEQDARLILPADLADRVRDILRPYAQLSRITLSAPSASTLSTYAYADAQPITNMPSTKLSHTWRDDGMGLVCLHENPYIVLCTGPKESVTTWAAQLSHPQIKRLSSWQALLIQHGHLFLPAAVSGLFTPNMLSLAPSKTVSLHKGCYLGQEVIARTYHLGQVKRFLHTFQTTMLQAPLPAGTVLQLADSNQKAYVVQSGITKNTLWFQVVMPECTPPCEFLLQDDSYPDPLLFQANLHPVAYF